MGADSAVAVDECEVCPEGAVVLGSVCGVCAGAVSEGVGGGPGVAVDGSGVFGGGIQVVYCG